MKNLRLRKILIPLLIFTFAAFFLFPKPVFANPDPGPLEWLLENTLGRITNAAFNIAGENLMKWVGDVMHFFIINSYTLFVDQWSGEGAGDVKGAAVPTHRGLVSLSGGLVMRTLQSPPNFYTAHFVKRELANNVLTPPVYARTGSSYFEAVVFIWRQMRNISYAFMTIILVMMGFMIMMRSQIAPRVVMTMVMALPRIAVSLVLITFSYPLAGLIVDLGRVLKKLIDSQLEPLIAPTKMTTVEPFHIIGTLFDRFVAVTPFDPGSWFAWGNIYLGGSGISAYLISLGIKIILVVVAFMLFFTLVTRFAGLFIQVVFAPFAFAWGALPGQEDTITHWFKSFAVNVLCFPIIYFLVNLAAYIADISKSMPMPMPEDLGWGTLTSVFGDTNVGGLVAFGLVMAATRVPAMLEDAFAVTAPAAVARAGVEPGKILGKLPVVGKVF